MSDSRFYHILDFLLGASLALAIFGGVLVFLVFIASGITTAVFATFIVVIFGLFFVVIFETIRRFLAYKKREVELLESLLQQKEQNNP